MPKWLDRFADQFRGKDKEIQDTNKKFGLYTHSNETFVRLQYAKFLALQVINDNAQDIRVRVDWAYKLQQLYVSYARTWKNKQMRDRSRAIQGKYGKWQADSQLLYQLEWRLGKKLHEIQLDPLSEEYSIKLHALEDVIPVIMSFIDNCGDDVDIAVQNIAMFQTMPMLSNMDTSGRGISPTSDLNLGAQKPSGKPLKSSVST